MSPAVARTPVLEEGSDWMSLSGDTSAWAVLVGVTASGSHASAHWFQGFLASCRERNLRICGVDFHESLQQGVTPIPVECLVTVPGPYTSELGAEQIAAVVEEIRARCGGQVVLSTALRENYQLLNSQLAQALGTMANDIACIRLIQDKPACRRALRQAGVPQPQSLRILGAAADGAPLFGDAAGTGVPAPRPARGGWIVKPATGMGSVGVHRIASLDELPDLGPEVMAGGYCLEEFVTGAEFSVEGLTVDGRVRVYTTTAKMINERYVETGHLQPAGPDRIPASCHLEEQLQTCIDALGIRCGHLHAEFWVTPEDKVVWGEFHVRQGGDFIAPDLVSAVRPGLDFYGELVDSLRGQALGPIPQMSRHAGARFLETAAGTVVGTSLDGRIPAGTFIYWECRPGETVHAVNGLRARAAAALACGDDEPAVEAMLAGAIDACDARVDVDQTGRE